MPKAARILIADDHALIREGLKIMLSDEEEGFEVVGEAQDGHQALALCRDLHPDLVLMDVGMPKMDGLVATKKIKQEMPKTSVLMVTMHENPDYLLEALKAGAAGYVLKDAGAQRLLGAVRRTLEGESPLAQELSKRLLVRLAAESTKGAPEREDERKTGGAGGGAGPRSSSPRSGGPRLGGSRAGAPSSGAPSSGAPAAGRGGQLEGLLTPRELEVLRLLSRGQTNPQIAQNLLFSVGTVKAHVRNILSKLGVSDRTQAAVRAIEAGMFTSDID